MECLLKRFMFDGFFSSNLTQLPVQQKIAGFPSSDSVTRGSNLLQTIGSHVVDQLHSPLRPISSQRLYHGNPFQLS